MVIILGILYVAVGSYPYRFAAGDDCLVEPIFQKYLWAELPITIFLLDESGEGQDFFQIEAANGPLFVMEAQLPLGRIAGGLVVHVATLKRSGFFDDFGELL